MFLKQICVTKYFNDIISDSNTSTCDTVTLLPVTSWYFKPETILAKSI